MCICTSSYRPYYPRDSQLAQRLQVNQTMGKQVLRLFRGCRRWRAARLDHLRHQDALSKGRILRMKQSRRSRVQLRLENSSVVPLLLAARGHAVDVHVVAGVAHRPEAIVRIPECAVCLPFLSKNEIIKACSQSHSNGIAERNY